MIKDIFEATVAIVILVGGVSVLAVIMFILMKVTEWLLSDDKGNKDEHFEKKDCISCTHSDELDGEYCYECVKGDKDNFEADKGEE